MPHQVEARSLFFWGVAKLVKAADFDSAMRGFESFLPSQTIQSGTRHREVISA
jgi:hypothetical protein